MDGAMEYLMPNSVKQGAEAYENSKFQAVIAGKAKEARLVFTDGGLTWTYNQNWSIARLEKDGYLPLELEDLSWKMESLPSRQIRAFTASLPETACRTATSSARA